MSTIEFLFKRMLGLFRPVTFVLILVVGVAAGYTASAMVDGDSGIDNTATPAQDSNITVAKDPNHASSTQGLQQDTLSEEAAKATERTIQRIADLVAIVETKISDIQKNSPFAAWGKNLIAVLGSVAVIWAFIKNMALKGNVSQIVPDLLFPTIVIGLTVIALDHGFAESVSKTVQGLSNGFGEKPSSGAFVRSMFMAMKSMWQQHSTSTNIIPSLSELAALGLQIVALIFLIVGTAFGVGVLLMAKFQIALAIALAPVMIPWLLFKPAEFLFTGWLTFLIKGGFMVVAVGAVSAMIKTSLAEMSAFAADQAQGMDAVWAYGAIAAMSMLFAYLLKESASIGSGIISGGPSGIAGFGHVAGGMGGRMVGAGAAMTAGMAMGAGKTALSAGTGAAHSGKTDKELNPMQRAFQPRQGTFQRAVYEAARGAPSDEQRQDVRAAEKKEAAQKEKEANPSSKQPPAPTNKSDGGGSQATAAPTDSRRGGDERAGPGGYSHPAGRGGRGDVIDVEAREVSESVSSNGGAASGGPVGSGSSAGESYAQQGDRPGPGGYSHPQRRGGGENTEGSTDVDYSKPAVWRRAGSESGESTGVDGASSTSSSSSGASGSSESDGGRGSGGGGMGGGA